MMKRYLVYGVGPFKNSYNKSWIIAHIKALLFNLWPNLSRYKVIVRRHDDA